jgi:hypothetical protein
MVDNSFRQQIEELSDRGLALIIATVLLFGHLGVSSVGTKKPCTASRAGQEIKTNRRFKKGDYVASGWSHTG